MNVSDFWINDFDLSILIYWYSFSDGANIYAPSGFERVGLISELFPVYEV